MLRYLVTHIKCIDAFNIIYFKSSKQFFIILLLDEHVKKTTIQIKVWIKDKCPNYFQLFLLSVKWSSGVLWKETVKGVVRNEWPWWTRLLI